MRRDKEVVLSRRAVSSPTSPRANGLKKRDSTTYTPLGFRRDQVLRLIAQELTDLGLHKAVQAIQEEAGISVHDSAMAEFRAHTLAGDWDIVLRSIPRIPTHPTAHLDEIRFLVLEQKFRELVLAGNTSAAVACLRNEIGPLKCMRDRMHNLTMSLLDPDFEEERDESTDRHSRKALLTALQAYIPSDSLVPENRLERLLAMAAQHQIDKCVYHNTTLSYPHHSKAFNIGTKLRFEEGDPGSQQHNRHNAHQHSPSSSQHQHQHHSPLSGQRSRVGFEPRNNNHNTNNNDDDYSNRRVSSPVGEAWDLLSDHVCTRLSLPHKTLHILTGHTDEVWHIVYSLRGDFLASGSKDGSVMIWEVTDQHEYTLTHTLSAHNDSVSCITFSPDSSRLLTCGQDGKAKLWATETGALVHLFDHHLSAITSAAWLPDNNRFVTASLDRSIVVMHVSGAEMQRWSGAAIHDIKVSRDGTRLIAVPYDKHILIFNLETMEEMQRIVEDCLMTSLDITPDGSTIVVNTSHGNGELRVIDVEWRKVTGRLHGHLQRKFVIRSVFGGLNNSFVASGSEDSKVYIWNHSVGTLLETLEGHTSVVNSVSWNPVHPGILASASDDHTVRIWCNAD